MAPRIFRFDAFLLDPDNRQLTRDGAMVELNSRYFDVLALLVREDGKLISKDRFFDEVWQGVPVTDEALTQCVKTLRRQLGDDAARPRFIETVPKHGYRFIAAVEGYEPDGKAAVQPVAGITPWTHFLLVGAAGTVGGGLAGVLGGLAYGLIGAFEPLQPAMGAASVLMVLVALSLVIGLIAGAGVGFGIALAGLGRDHDLAWSIGGGALGGLVIGAIVKLLGMDVFGLLFGQTPGDIAGAAEGALLGGAVGFAVWYAKPESFNRSIGVAALAGAVTGALIPLFGGRLMGGSLDMLARQFPQSRLRFDQVGNLFGETEFGPVSQIVTSSVEGLLFAACAVGAILTARQYLAGRK